MNDPEDRFAVLDLVLIGGREPRKIVIVDYDPAWPRRFELEQRRISAALGPRAIRIEHIGSTSVPHLAAKAIIDIVVTVPDIDAEDVYGQPLLDAGYVLRVRESGHRMFRTPELDVHVHVYNDGAPEVERYLVLRTWLCEHEADRQLYAAHKRQLAQRSWGDMNEYADAKSEVIADILARADGASGEPAG